MPADLQAQQAQRTRAAAPGPPRSTLLPKALAALILGGAIVLFALGHVNWGLGLGIGGMMLLAVYLLVRDPPPPHEDDPNTIDLGR